MSSGIDDRTGLVWVNGHIQPSAATSSYFRRLLDKGDPPDGPEERSAWALGVLRDEGLLVRYAYEVYSDWEGFAGNTPLPYGKAVQS